MELNNLKEGIHPCPKETGFSPLKEDKTPYPVCTACNSILLDYFAGWFKCSQCGKIVSGESIFYFLNEEGKDILFESIFYF